MDVYDNIIGTTMKKEVNLSSLHPKEEKEMEQLFHIKIQVKKTNINTLSDFGSQENPITEDLYIMSDWKYMIIPVPTHWDG